MRRWWQRACAIGVVIFAAAILRANPGTVQTDDNHAFNGDVSEDAKYVTVTSRGIAIKIDRRNVAKITYVSSVDDQFHDQLSRLAASDVKGRVDLAKWADDFDRPDLAITALNEAVKIDPTNADAAKALQAAQSQLEKSQHAHATTGAASQPATETTKAGKPLVRRLLTNDEINLIRQTEMSGDDSKLRVQFENGVIRRFLDSGDHDPQAFRNLTQAQQAEEILTSGSAKMANDVRIVSDPAPLLEFRNKVYPLIATACGSAACHGGTHAGDFALFPGSTSNVVYTNFYILQNYSHVSGGVEYFMIDRTLPDRSLLLQYALPDDQTNVAHPAADDFKPRYRTKSDVGFLQWHDWIANSLRTLTPDYGLPVAWKLTAAPPVTQP